MIRTPIHDKKTMYRLLQGGALGNTIPIYTSLLEWQRSPDLEKYDLWGIRVLKPGDPRMRLNIPRGEVGEYICTHFPNHQDYNISPMIDQWCLFRGEIMEEDYFPFSLYLYGAFGQEGTWRDCLRNRGKSWRGVSAKVILEGVCDTNSYEDIRELLTLYPGHVVEFTVCSRLLGNLPHRNTVIWEVRKY